MAIYAGKFDQTNGWDYRYSFALETVGWILSWVAIPVFFLDDNFKRPPHVAY